MNADGAKLKPGLYTSDDNWLYLYEDGFGTLACNRGPEAILHGILWTENRLQIEGEEVKFSFNKNKLSFTYDGVPFETTCLDLRYVFKCGFPVRAGYYASDDGERLILALDGRGLYVDGDGPRAIWWGWQCPFGKDRSQYYILFDSALSEMVFADETLSFQNGAGKQIEMSRTGKLGSIGMDVIDEKQDFQFHMPVTGWETNNVKHTQVVAAPKAKGGVDKFLFMSAKASKTGPEAEIAYADAAHRQSQDILDATLLTFETNASAAQKGTLY